MFVRNKFAVFLLFLLIFNISFKSSADTLRVVSLYPPVTHEIFMLKEGNALVGCSNYGIVPNGFKVKRVGSVMRADIERILKLKPTVVIVGNLMNINDIHKLRELKIKVVVFKQPKNFKDMCAQMLKVGKTLKKEKTAKEVVDKAKNEILRIKEKVIKLKKPKVLIQIGANPLFAAGEDYFINDFVAFAGGANIVKKSGIYSVEDIVRKNPDVIIISQMGFNGIKQKKKWGKFKFLKAVKMNKILILDDYSLCSPTPPTFVKTVVKIAEFLHPEIAFENKH